MREFEKMKSLVFALLLITTGLTVYGQKYPEAVLKDKLDSMSLRNPGLNNAVQLNVSGLPLYEFIYSLGLENNLNITIEPSLNESISYNFFDAKVKDILVFMYINFELEYEFVGSIIAVKKRTVFMQPVVVSSKELDIKYNTANEFLSLNLQNDTLWKVLEKITVLSDKNFVINPEIRNKQVSAFFQNRPYEQVLDMFVQANGLVIDKEKEGFYVIESDVQKTNIQNTSQNTTGSRPKPNSIDFTLVKNGMGNIDIFANNIDLVEIIKAASLELNKHYVLHSNVDGKANLELKNVSYEELLKNLFVTTKYNYDLSDDIYVIGERKMEGIRKTELIRMENRSVENVKNIIPKELLADVDITDFLDLNGLIVTGSERGIQELKNFLSSIDIVVPMIQIDVIFLSSSSGNSKSAGLKAGIKPAPTTTTGGIDETGINGTFGAEAINNLLSAISGFGVLNLGQVTENFYISLSALEENHIINTESTPKISTLNGQKGTISIGETKYYQQQQVNVQTSVQQSGVISTKNWTPVKADLTVTIIPFVSSDEQITMTIVVKNSDFGEQKDATSPPNSSDQSFESTVRVKNGEVILLGGLEKKSKSNSGKGVPFLSKIPVIKWLFSSRISEKEKSKLHILIKPTVTY